MLRIFEKPEGGGENVTYLFDFKTSEAREEAKAVKDLLSKLLADLRSNDASVPRAADTSAPSAATNGNASGSVSGSMAFASAVNAQPSSSKWFDDNQLKNDIELQQSLMKKDKSLHQTYMEAMSTKPESISGAAFNSQFWSARTNMLRAHAIEISQKKGAYNVLATVKPRTVDGDLKLNLSVEQVQMIFAQHPLVKRIYNENVPRLSESQFWSRFFLSRLSKKLRGERANDSDPVDALFDKYDISENTQGIQSRIMAQSVPHIIDLEGNEENQGGFRSGNARDVEMRPRSHIPIVRTLNSLSEKIMANVAPSDVYDATDDAHSQFALRDLRGELEDSRIHLNVKEQNKFFSKHDAAPSSNAKLFASQNPTDVLATVRRSLHSLGSDTHEGINIDASIGIDDDSDSDDDAGKVPHVGSRAATRTADQEIMDGLRQRRAQAYGGSTDETAPLGLSASLAEKCALTHATTMEFLHQFWNAFLSGDADRAAELQYLAESLSRSADRIAAVAAEAEPEALVRRKQEIKNIYQSTGRKMKLENVALVGGRMDVEKMMRPALEALEKAKGEYARALAAEGVKISSE